MAGECCVACMHLVFFGCDMPALFTPCKDVHAKTGVCDPPATIISWVPLSTLKERACVNYHTSQSYDVGDDITHRRMLCCKRLDLLRTAGPIHIRLMPSGHPFQ
jgi:hypothetical protein